jgi:hypothetical protein
MPGRSGLVPGSLSGAAHTLFQYPAGTWTPPSCDETWNPGFPLNLDMRFGPAAGDFPPKHLDLAASSSPLLSALGSSYGWPTALAERALIGRDVDMITGSPLLQATDLELPFGSATFRWTRTFSEIPQFEFHQHECSSFSAGWDFRFRDFNPQAQYWDWAGQGWMLGVSPLLLIDAGYWGINDEGGTRCYFMPDGHHSVPFLKLPGGGTGAPRYEAPPRFDAVLGHNETFVSINGEQMPTEWYVWTHRRSIKYTFKPVYDDTGWIYHGSPNRPPPPAVSEHALPGPIMNWHCETGAGKGLGVPYYAVVKAIEDLQGNRIEFEYSDFTREILVNPPLLPSGAAEALQNSQSKGQIRRIRLTRNGVTAPRDTVWTLIPVYREFGGSAYVDSDPINNPQGYTGGVYRIPDHLDPAKRFENQHAVDSVFVYRGEVAAPSQANALTLPNTLFVDGESRADPLPVLHAIAAIDAQTYCNLPSDWEHRIRYIYADGSDTFRQNVTALDFHSPIGYHSLAGVWQSSCPPLQSPRLLLTRVTTKTTALPKCTNRRATRCTATGRSTGTHPFRDIPTTPGDSKVSGTRTSSAPCARK